MRIDLSLDAINAKRKRPLTLQQMLDRVCYKSSLGHTSPCDIGTIAFVWVNDKRKYFVFGATGWRQTTKDRAENPTTFLVTIDGREPIKMVAVDADIVFDRAKQLWKAKSISYHAV